MKAVDLPVNLTRNQQEISIYKHFFYRLPLKDRRKESLGALPSNAYILMHIYINTAEEDSTHRLYQL